MTTTTTVRLQQPSRAPHTGATYTSYESAKQAWLVSHPESTPAEYELAMRSIAKRLGL